MRRRLLLLAAVAVPSVAGIAASAHGCSDEQPFESVCLWMADPDNCYRELREDMKATANPLSPDNPNGDCTTLGTSTEATGSTPGTANGSFLTRAMLDTCIIDQGGQVMLAPPLDLTMWPPSPYATPITYTMTFQAADGNTCGTATYTSPHGFSITINPLPDGGVGTARRRNHHRNHDHGHGRRRPRPPHPYGTFTEVIAPGRDAFDVTCPSGETHHFDLNEVEGLPGADGGACPTYADFLPSASFQVYPGGVNTAGAISFAIVYPPIPAPGAADTYPLDGSAPPVPNPATVYFNCTIPGAEPQCGDGVKDGAETDIDCGGPTITLDGGACPARCMVGQGCLHDSDCATGIQCLVNPMSGARQCGCIPKTTCGAGQNCGMASDGCGGMLSCGACAANQACNGNVCCNPKTACPAGFNCGQVSDGCGGTIPCGTCTAPKTCTSNVCQ